MYCLDFSEDRPLVGRIPIAKAQRCSCLTEINIARFFTTHLFFTQAGLNMPHIFVRLAFGEEPPEFGRKLNPLPSGLAWIRGMDMEPVLTDVSAIRDAAEELRARRAKIGQVGLALQ